MMEISDQVDVPLAPEDEGRANTAVPTTLLECTVPVCNVHCVPS